MKKQVVRILLSFLLVGIIVSCSGKKAQQGGAQVQELKVMIVDSTTVTVHFDYPATLKGQQVIDIRPKIDGYIDAILVEEGATVKKGQVLFRISNPLYEQSVRTAEASIKSAEADVYTAKMNVNKVTPLVQKDIVSKYELESVQYTLQAKQAALAQAQASLSVANANLNYTIIRSPLDGIIGSIPYKMGALVSSSSADPLTVLSDVTNVYAYFALNEKQLIALSNETPGATLQDKMNYMPRVGLLLSDGTTYPETGKMEMASGLIATETGSASLKALFPNAQRILRSGGSAIIRLPRTIKSALMIPQSATYEVLDKRFVFIVKEDNKVYNILIKATPTDDGQFFIVTEGLNPGDHVVLEGITGLKDSTLIVPKMMVSDSVYKALNATKNLKK